MPEDSQELAEAKHLRELLERDREAAGTALRLQAEKYDIRAAEQDQRIAKHTDEIARVVWVAAGISMALSALVAISGLAVAIFGLYLANRR